MSKKIDLYVSCCNEKLAYRLDKRKVDFIVVGLKGFSCRINNFFNLDTIARLKKNLKYSKLCVFLNNLYSETEIEKLENVLEKLSELKVDLIMFSDFAIPQIIYEKKLNLPLHYNPETLVTSYGQFDFYLENNINKVNLASELTLSEIKRICENKNQMYVSIKGFGLGFVMHSRWKMISTFLDYAKANKAKFNSTDYLLIKEDERVVPNIIFEDEMGTHMLTGYYICCLKQINEIKNMNIDALIIDSLFVHDDDLTLDFILEAYKFALKNNLNDKQLEIIYQEVKKKCELDISPGFFGNHTDVLHTKKHEE
ncbi:MAG: U32 family peptidase [Malacoplasma sp.]|nr:U32 family peptidase [Malacoplasma sp.]MDE6894209.1 U32 family peptidase [Malacoplasma sp.]MDE7088110.1 U32 family peptidase [Malacoplasma sp.]